MIDASEYVILVVLDMLTTVLFKDVLKIKNTNIFNDIISVYFPDSTKNGMHKSVVSINHVLTSNELEYKVKMACGQYTLSDK